MITKEIWVNKNNFRQTQAVELPQQALSNGEIRVSIDKFALTSNNIGYAVSGESLSYWSYFPTNNDDWGKVTVWGIADVIDSKHPDIKTGERLYGFLPMASHLTLQPGETKASHFIDTSAHRQHLPPFYNQYQRCQTEPDMMRNLEDERCVLFPLYFTGFIIADFLMDNDYFDAEQIIIGSVSSKTGYSIAAFLKSNGYLGKVVGLTSHKNIDFVNDLAICDQILSYEQAAEIDNVSAVYVDMSGDSKVLANLHNHLQDNMKSSQIVGATHWESFTGKQDLPGVKPTFFFTPKHIKKRSDEWGATVLMEKSFMSAAQLSQRFKHLLKMEHHFGAQAVEELWQGLLDNKVSGQRGLMLSLHDK